MRKTFAILALLLPIFSVAQGVRVDLPLRASGPNVPVHGGPLPQSLILANASVSICAHPAPSLSSCAPVTTYTDATLHTACPSNTPIVQLPGSACVGTTGISGNLGFWYSGGLVDYFVNSPYGLLGPYTTSGGTTGPPGAANSLAIGTVATLPPNTPATATIVGSPPSQTLNLGIPAGSPGTSGNPAAPSFAVQFANSGASQFQADSTITINPTSHAFAAPIIGGFNYAAQYQTSPGSNNGIVQCFLTQTYCVADPSYPLTEKPFSFSGTKVPGATNAFFQDYGAGSMGVQLHNPGTNRWLTSYRLPWLQVMVSDTIQSPPTGSGSITSPLFPMSQWLYFQNPCYSLGNPGFGPNGWCTQEGHVINMLASSPGISAGISVGVTKTAIGDNVGITVSDTCYGGAIAASDEGCDIFRGLGGTAVTQYVGAVNTGSTGATSLTVNCTQDCANPSDGRYLMLSTPIASGSVTANTAPSGNTPGHFATDQSNTASTAWGTMNGNCIPAVTTPFALVGSSITCNVTMLSGTFSANDHVCFAGTYHEHAIVTSATSTTVTFTNVAGVGGLRHQHASGTWLMAGPPCGTFINFPSNDSTPVSQNLQYPIDIIGSTASGTLQYAFFDSSSSNTGFPAGTGQFNTQTFAATALTNVGGIVTMAAGSGNITSQPQLYGGVTITISNAADSAYNGACTNSFHTPNGASNSLSCTQPSSNGHSASATGTIALATNSYIQLAGAEVLDDQTYSAGNPATISPGNVTTFALEPNNAAWTASAGVIQPQHYAMHGFAQHFAWFDNNYYANRTGGISWGYSGSRISGGNPANITTYAAMRFANGNANSMYTYQGGSVTGPGGISFTGIHSSYLATQYAPDSIGSSALYFGCPASGCTDKDFFYNVFTTVGSGNAADGLIYKPAIRQYSWPIGTNFALPTNMAGQTFNGNIVGQALSTPAAPTATPQTSGGTIPDGTTTRCYVIAAHATNGDTATGAQFCPTFGTSGGNNAAVINWAFQTGAASYKLCIGPSGGPYNLLATVGGTTYFDTGAAAGAACSTTNTSQPSITGFKSIGLIDQPSGFSSTIDPTALTANRTITLPDTTGTVVLSGVPANFVTTAEFSLGTCTTAKTVDPVNGNRQKVTLTNAQTCALTFTQPASGTANVTLKVTQSSVSTFNGGISGCKWPGGVIPTITQTSAAIDFISIYLDGTNSYCTASQNFQ